MAAYLIEFRNHPSYSWTIYGIFTNGQEARTTIEKLRGQSAFSEYRLTKWRNGKIV